MPGRQAHGRAPTSKSLGNRARKQREKRDKSNPKTNAGHRERALDALEIAAKLYPEAQKKKGRDRIIDIDDGPQGKKHARNEAGDNGEDLHDGPQRKKIRGPQQGEDDESDVEYGSDDEGNNWRLGGPVDEDEDSEIESDDAFGESDEEKFKDFTFGGSKSRQKDGESESEGDDESLGEDAIDLATALDQAMGESSESEEGSGSEDEEDDDDSDTDADDGESGLEKLMTQYGAKEAESGPGKSKKPAFAIIDEPDEPAAEKIKTKISLSDLGLSDLKDINMRKSIKLMAKEEKETRPGETKKVLKPLPKLHQDRIDRQAAFETTVKTLSRWTETIKANRRADHLVFPLPQERVNAGLSNTEFQPINPKTATSELEQTMLELLGPNGLDREPRKQKKKEEKDPAAAIGLSARAEEIRKRNEELVNQRRKERELQSREAKKHSRLKKIKSKAFHRVHRKQKLKDMQDDEEELDSEAEREAHDRRRALERVGARHKNSSWGKKAQRAVWDDEYRTGLVEAARKEHELRKRVEGRTGSNSEDESSEESASDSEGERDRLLQKVDEMEGEDSTSKNQLLNLKFMRNGEEQLRKENERLISDIRKTLDDGEGELASEEDGPTIGRRNYGPAINGQKAAGVLVSAKKKPAKKVLSQSIVPGDNRDDDDDVDIYTGENDGVFDPNAWSKGRARKGGSGVTDLHVINNEDSGAKPDEVPQPKTRNKSISKHAQPDQALNVDNDESIVLVTSQPKRTPALADDRENMDSDSVDDSSGQELDLLDSTDKLILEAFGGGDEVLAEFEKEKEELAEEQDDKVIDNTLPGWGSWVGEGVSAREKKRHSGRFLQKVEGVKKKERKDAKLQRVIMHEQRVKKNERYLASMLPHPYESKEQYERSLRLPMGKEWVTRETFHDGTKPRVIMKPGVIAPISRPTA